MNRKKTIHHLVQHIPPPDTVKSAQCRYRRAVGACVWVK